ncbi:MAG: tetratricopeptide repeat protein [Desulfuromonadales bacterium]|nr:tetratricopeptide repeat protein [Desulfuromonadales bacterium]
MPRTLTICIVEDGGGLCRQLNSDLTKAGHRLHCLLAHASLVSQIAAKEPDLILLAVSESLGSELELYHRLTRHRQLKMAPIIVVSVYPDLEYELLDAFDFISLPLDIRRLQASIDQLLQRRSARRWPDAHFFDAEQIEPFKRFIHDHAGLHFSSRNQRLLERGLTRRIQALYLNSPQSYLDYLGANENFDELNKLLSLLTVGETCFFRYRSHRESMLHDVVPRLIKANRAERQLRIWSAGCSTGEEPYSMAILLLEHFPELADWDVQILATDINKHSLRKAREGVYGSRSLRLVEDSLRQRYFEESGGYYLVKPQVRVMVRFSYLNLQLDDYPHADSSTCDIDLLFCRNVLIYFQPETMRQIVARFARSLRPQVFLFMGHAETLQNISDRFRRQQRQGAFFYQLKTPALKVPAPQPQSTAPPLQAAPPVSPPVVPPPVVKASAPPPPKPEPEPPKDLDALYQQAMAALDHEKNTEAERCFDAILQEQPHHPRALVGKGLMCANQGDYGGARKLCARAISQDDLLPEAYLLRGLILDMEGASARALVEYQKVLWLDQTFIMAHYLAAKAQARLGQDDKSRRCLRNALRYLERSVDQPLVPYSGGLSQPVFLEIIHHDLAVSATS